MDETLKMTVSRRSATLLYEALEDAEPEQDLRAAAIRLVRHELEIEGRSVWGELWWMSSAPAR